MTIPDGAAVDRPSPRCLLIVPCLNERDHIGPLLDYLLVEAAEVDGLIVVADGGSTDGTQAIVTARSHESDAIRLCHNPDRIQSAGINRAVERYGAQADFLIRIDAHGAYPPGYCRTLVEEAVATKAGSVVVSMQTTGAEGFQAAVAVAQNGRLGTGGSAHRMGGRGGWVDHGHHALMRVEAFKAVGGYDETFSHNEDAELDHRLGAAGVGIWMTMRTRMTYFPRSTPGSLFRQYLGYGRGRARNMIKHRMLPKLRQALPLGVAPALALVILAPVHPVFAVPALVWAAACLGIGIAGFLRTRQRESFVASIAAMVMHVAWSAGFWLELAGRSTPRGRPS